MSQIRILIVEDEPLIAVDIEQILTNINFEVSAIAFTPEEAIKQLKTNTPDAILLDINLDDTKDGIDIAEIINQQYQLPFIFLTSHADRATLERAKKTKPAGYIVKPFDEKDVLAGLEIALYNHAQKQTILKPTLFIHNINKHIFAPLTEREFDVLQGIYEGKTNQQMAADMFVSINTIKTHIGNIFFKLDVTSRTAAVAKVRVW
ncbi:MAG: response regulator transcription factor [Chitinophagaceae bacterium]|jgi:DNA-binding NarL/FixJ family response regulator